MSFNFQLSTFNSVAVRPPMLQPADNGERYELLSPTVMPRAAGFLWNPRMMIQVTCRGYAVAQFMQPEPAKYAYAPNLEAKTFMQPEQPYYAHHPGRFFYIKDEETGQVFSAPYEPVRAPLDCFRFSVGKSDIRWLVEKNGIALDITLGLSAHDVVELWEVQVRNISGRPRRLSLYSYFPVGYMSWMNQSAQYRQDLGGIVASCVTPYQKVADYFKNRNFKDKTFCVADKTPAAWEAKQETFEGEGGLHNPSAVQQAELSKGDALYETPAAILQYRLQIAPGESSRHRFIFGPAFDDAEIIAMRDRYLGDEGFSRATQEYAAYVDGGKGCLKIRTPDPELDNFVNHWLPRQMFYHGDVNRLTTDPQTRNYLQDNMGMTWIRPQVARAAFLHALSQQEASGAMPDGILLVEGAELKYINQIPHTDHCVWLPVCLKAYLDETNDYAILREPVKDHAGQVLTVFQRISNAMRWLLNSRDHRGLSYIAQGDWCDPMNMVGYKGKGVSGWLSVATAYALNLWTEMCIIENDSPLAEEFTRGARAINDAVNTHLWDGHWFARGITDDGVVFGTSKDKEGRIFLNAQGWSLLSGAAVGDKRDKVIAAVREHLETPYGTMTLAPAYTAMRDDVGRVTQKFPGSAENGSVYNHDAVFYIYSLYTIGNPSREAPEQLSTPSTPPSREAPQQPSTINHQLSAPSTPPSSTPSTTPSREAPQQLSTLNYRVAPEPPAKADQPSTGLTAHAFSLLRRMLPGPDMADYQQRGLLPVFIPNYYRGAWRQHPRTAGRSSQLFNTGTVSWYYRCLVEGLFGLKGDRHGLQIQPQLPAHWDRASVTREFRGATFHVEMRRTRGVSAPQVTVDGSPVAENRISNFRPGQVYNVQIALPAVSQ